MALLTIRGNHSRPAEKIIHILSPSSIIGVSAGGHSVQSVASSAFTFEPYLITREGGGGEAAACHIPGMTHSLQTECGYTETEFFLLYPTYTTAVGDIVLYNCTANRRHAGKETSNEGTEHNVEEDSQIDLTKTSTPTSRPQLTLRVEI